MECALCTLLAALPCKRREGSAKYFRRCPVVLVSGDMGEPAFGRLASL
jgi:hypothetical protein